MIKLITPRLTLNLAHEVSYLKLKDFETRNIDHLTPWETMSADSSDDNYKNRLAIWRQDFDEGRSLRFVFFLSDDIDQRIVGICNFTHIMRGAFQACYLGYKIDFGYQGKGLMMEALRVAIQYIFEERNLHRIMANYMPRNVRSAQLLKRLGFIIEGEAKEYLLINGIWEDHVMAALINENWKLAWKCD